VYIANWTDSTISLVANTPVKVANDYQKEEGLTAFLSPLSDFSPFTFGIPSTGGCPVAAADTLTFTVTNPQTGNSANTRVTVSSTTAPGTTLN
jgi:hypothetical protein